MRAGLSRMEAIGKTMGLIVHKYGGTSMGSTERIRSVAQRVAKWVRAGHQLVVVPSAMSGETNRLLGRTPPTQRFQVADIDIYVHLDGSLEGRVPFLLDELARVFGLDVVIDSETLDIHDSKVLA